MGSMDRAGLAELIGQATVDCYNESECITGFFTMLDEHLDLPFRANVLGQDVTVSRVDVTADEQIVAICTHAGARLRIPILELPLPTPPPAGADWIAAYRLWAR